MRGQKGATERVGGCLPREGALGPAFVKLDLVHRPNSTLDILDAHKALVQRQIVPHCVLYIK